MKKILVLFITTVLLVPAFLYSQTVHKSKPLALIYFGPGSCIEDSTTQGCSQAARDMAINAGFDVEFVGPTGSITSSFSKAAIWIQPGGRARKQAEVMSPELKAAVYEFVQNGGGYVGFCAGGFLATETFGWNDEEKGPFEAKGFGFLPGKSWYFEDFDKELDEYNLAKIISTTWNGQSRQVYWELGPYFNPESYVQNEKVSFYQDLLTKEDSNKAMIIYARSGKGKVAISATHPEAPQSWRDYYKIIDSDSVDFDIAQDMITWAAEKN